MKLIVLIAATGSLAACASGLAPLVEAGYQPGALGLSAISRQDWVAAERALTQSPIGDDDPARLINLGRVYAATGRLGQAVQVWQRALDGDRHFMVETVTGEWVSTRALAQRALSQHAMGGPVEPD
jgi:hypothetical protein